MLKHKLYEFSDSRRGTPNIEVFDDEVAIGGEDEGYSYWTPENFYDLIKAVNDGMFADFEKAMVKRLTGEE